MPAADPTTSPNPTGAQAQAADAGGAPAAEYAAQQAAKEAAFRAHVAASDPEAVENEIHYSPTLVIFDPPDSIVGKIMNDLCDPVHTLRDIASKARTTLDALTVWLARPDIAERLNNYESACARRVRMLSTSHLPSVVEALHGIVRQFIYLQDNVPLDRSSFKALEYERRGQETARKASALLMRLARYHPGAARTRLNSPSQMGARAGGRVDEHTNLDNLAVRSSVPPDVLASGQPVPNPTNALALFQLLLTQLQQRAPITNGEAPHEIGNGHHPNGHVNRLPPEDQLSDPATSEPPSNVAPAPASTSGTVAVSKTRRGEATDIAPAGLPIPLPQLKSAPPAQPTKSPQPKPRNRPP